MQYSYMAQAEAALETSGWTDKHHLIYENTYNIMSTNMWLQDGRKRKPSQNPESILWGWGFLKENEP